MDYSAQIDQAANLGAHGHNNLPEPTQAMNDAGSYQKGHFVYRGMPISIENPRGSVRKWRADDGTSGENLMRFHYGEFDGTRGNDGDAVDCFVGPYPEADQAYVINQFIRGAYDETKVMLGFPDQRMAEAGYMSNFTPGWTGLNSCVPCTIAQLKDWLANGDHTIPLTAEQLSGRNVMDKVLWDSANVPMKSTLAQVLYAIRLHDAADGLIFDSVTVADILADPEVDGVLALDALIVPMGKLSQRMAILQKVMDRAGGDLRVSAMQVTAPYTTKGTTNVAVVYELSDGQTLAVFFHNPDVTPKKITPTDEMVSWKWMLNKKDVTIAVAPERGRDLNVRMVAQRVMALAAKNSARFVAANGKRAERMQGIVTLEAEFNTKTETLNEMLVQISELEANPPARAVADPVPEPIVDIPEPLEPVAEITPVPEPVVAAEPVIEATPSEVTEPVVPIEPAEPAVVAQVDPDATALEPIADIVPPLEAPSDPSIVEGQVPVPEVAPLQPEIDRVADVAAAPEPVAAVVDLPLADPLVEPVVEAAVATEETAQPVEPFVAPVDPALGVSVPVEPVAVEPEVPAVADEPIIAPEIDDRVAAVAEPDPVIGPEAIVAEPVEGEPGSMTYDPTTPDHYAFVMQFPELQEMYQDQLDSFMQHRLIDVRNAMRGLGWDGERFGALSKNGIDATFDFTNVGAGANLVGYSVALPGTDPLVDMLTTTPVEFAALVDGMLPATVVAVEPEPVIEPVIAPEETPAAINTPVGDPVMLDYIRIAADSIEALRRIDVYRVLDSIRSDNIDGVTRAMLATWIVANRPDLTQEVTDVMAEEFPSDGWPVAALAAVEPVPIVVPEPELVAPPAEIDVDAAFMASIIDGTRDMTDPAIPAALKEIFPTLGDDAAKTEQFTQAVNAYKTFAIARAKEKLATV